MVQLYPEFFARFYDLIYHTQRDSIDNEFFQNEILNTKGRVLEIGVGTGRMFTTALKNGADIYGIDISPAMLDVLRNKLPAKQHYRISLQNMIDFHFDYKFDLIIAPFRVIMHIIDKSDQLRAINNVYGHLKKKGRFIFDAFVPDLKQLISGIHEQTDFEGEYEKGKKVRRIVNTDPDIINQLINVNFRIEWEENNIVRSEKWDQPLRFFHHYELEHLIERSKFRKYRIAGDYNGNELNRDSREFVVTCIKRKKDSDD